jgi:hypothetical protein
MRKFISLTAVLIALAFSGCSVLGYRQVDDLKENAKYSSDVVEKGNAVVIYRDTVRRYELRRSEPTVGRFTRVESELDRATESGHVTMLHDGRIIAHTEIAPVGDDGVRVRKWWLLAVGRFQ